jgi:hypothetical protein
MCVSCLCQNHNVFCYPTSFYPPHTHNRPSSTRRTSNLRSARTPNCVCPMLSTIHTSPQSSYLSATEPRHLTCPKPLTPSQAAAALHVVKPAAAALHVVKPSRSMVGHRKGTRRPSCFPVLGCWPATHRQHRPLSRSPLQQLEEVPVVSIPSHD